MNSNNNSISIGHDVTQEHIDQQQLIEKINKENYLHTLDSIHNFLYKEHLRELVLVSKKENKNENNNDGNVRNDNSNIIPPNAIPHKVENLTLRGSFIIGENDIPNSVTSIHFEKQSQDINFNFIPSTIESITFSKYINVIIQQPLNSKPALKYLSLTANSLSLLNYTHLFPSLKTISINGCKEGEIYHIQEGILSLIFGSAYNKPLPTMPSSLLSLKIKKGFNRELNIDKLPSGLEELDISNKKLRFTLEEFKPLSNLKILKFYSPSIENDILDFELSKKYFTKLQLLVFNGKPYATENNTIKIEDYV